MEENKLIDSIIKVIRESGMGKAEITFDLKREDAKYKVTIQVEDMSAE